MSDQVTETPKTQAEEAREAKMAKLNEVHDPSKVYARVNGGNDEITFDARIKKTVNGVEKDEKVPVTALNNNKMESHFFFDKAPETKA